MAFTVRNPINVADIVNVFTTSVINTIKSGAYHLNNPPMDGAYPCVPSTMMDDINNLPTPTVGVSGGKITASSIATALINVTRNLTRVGTFSYIRMYRTLLVVRTAGDPTYRNYPVGYVRQNNIVQQTTMNGKVVFTTNYIRALRSSTSPRALSYSPASYFTVSGAVITGLTATGKAAPTIVVPAIINGVNITSINANAFQGSLATSVTIPDTITNIGQRAFQNCTSLRTLVIYGKTTNIQNYAFQNCTALNTVTFYGKINSIQYAFYGCTALTTVNFYCELSIIGPYTFYNCQNIRSITLPGSLTTVNTYAFYNVRSITNVYYEAASTNWTKILWNNPGTSNIQTAPLTPNYRLLEPPQVTTAGTNPSHNVVAGNPITIATLNELCAACLDAWKNTVKFNYQFTNYVCHNDCHGNCHYNCYNDCHGDCYSD